MTSDDIRAMAERLDPEPRRSNKNWEAWSDRECNRSLILSAAPTPGAQAGVLLDLFNLVFAPKGWRLLIEQADDGSWHVSARKGSNTIIVAFDDCLARALYTAMKEIEGHD